MQNKVGKHWREGCPPQTTHSMEAYLTYSGRRIFSWLRNNPTNKTPQPGQGEAAPTSNTHLPPKNICSEQPLHAHSPCFQNPPVLCSPDLLVAHHSLCVNVLRFFYYSGVNLILLAQLLTFSLVKVDKPHYLFTSNKSRVFHILFPIIRLFALED